MGQARTSTLSGDLLGRPINVLLPAVVLFFGLLTSLMVGVLGHMHFRATSDQIAANRALAMGQTLAVRLKTTASIDHAQLLSEVAKKTGAELLVATVDGSITADATQGTGNRSRLLSLLVQGQGVTTTKNGRCRFFVQPIGGAYRARSLVVFVPSPSIPPGANALLQAVALWALILLSIAGGVAYLLGRDLEKDVLHMRTELSRIARPAQSSLGRPLPVRGVDHLARLTQAYNVLLYRFGAAARAYEVDLEHVASQDRDKAVFLAALSHELRTPLNAILGFTDLLLDEVDGSIDDDTRQNLSIVRSSGSHLRGLIDDILELSALESGQLRLSRATVNLNALIEDVSREVSIRLRDKPIKLVIVEKQSVRVLVDERRIWQVISNLVNNAIKFTHAGTVTIRIEKQKRDAVVTVTDTGTGIPNEEMESIFEEFHQVGTAQQRRQGVGLGLFIARRLVLMHGGTITASSLVGRGSTFRITLPAVPAEPEKEDIEGEQT